LTAVQVDIHKELIEQCRHGDRKAYYKVYKLYAKAMFNVCLRMLNSRSDAEDMLQEVFTEAFQRIHNFRFESTFGSWLKQIVVNKCINELKKKKTVLEFLDDMEKVDIVEEVDDKLSEYELAMNVENVKRAMLQLPDGSRTIFSLYLIEGYDHVEISEILHITESTSKSQYMRAKIKVKEILKEIYHER
jgi:RNA polymerase sigma-70 factor (ECF subfamily)